MRNEPIVRSPADALSCFRRSGIDLLVIGNSVIERGAFAVGGGVALTYRIRAGARLAGQLLRSGARTGRWWVSAILLFVILAALVGHAAAVAVPSAAYVLF